jgi:lysophospholipase L1-like esterase
MLPMSFDPRALDSLPLVDGARVSVVQCVLVAIALTAGIGRCGEPLRLLALGDSYTIGESVAAGQRWPVQLAAALETRGLVVAAPEIIATTGWTTDELAAGIDAVDPRGPYDLVTLLIGVNNQYRGRPVEAFRVEFRVLLQRAVGFAGGRPGRVIVMSIPDWGVMPFAEGRDQTRIAAEIDAYNAACLEEAVRAGVRYVNVTGISRNAAADPSLVADDGLHPSGAQYARWVDRALPECLAALGRVDARRPRRDIGNGRREAP